MNRATLIGNVGKDTESRTMQNGGKVVNLTLATTDRWKDKNSGEKKEATQWHKIVIFNEALGRVAEQYVKKGSKIAVEGKIVTRKWTDQQGVERYTTEIELGPFNSSLELLTSQSHDGDSGRSENPAPREQAGPAAQAQQRTAGGGGDIEDDAIPFGPCWQ